MGAAANGLTIERPLWSSGAVSWAELGRLAWHVAEFAGPFAAAKLVLDNCPRDGYRAALLVLTSVQVIEHIEARASVLAGIAGLLASVDLLILRTPNKLVDEPFQRLAGHEHH